MDSLEPTSASAGPSHEQAGESVHDPNSPVAPDDIDLGLSMTAAHNSANAYLSHMLEYDSDCSANSVSDLSDQESHSHSSSDSSYEAESEEDGSDDGGSVEMSFRERIRVWAAKHRITRECCNELLAILIKEGHNSLPKDSRTLLETMRTVPVIEKAGGRYVYSGIQEGLNRYVPENFVASEIKVLVNTDGIPIYDSSGKSLWPISIMLSPIGVFPAALWYGDDKPKPVEDYLRDFLDEVTALKKDGCVVRDQRLSFKIKLVTCDAPARAHLKCVAAPTGFNACERCTATGVTYEHRRVFEREVDVVPRTDAEFRDGQYMYGEKPHQHSVSPLLELGIPMVSGFPLDYMHLVLEGVQKRLLKFWKGSFKNIRNGALSSDLLKQLDSGISGIVNVVLPSEFNRQPRVLKYSDRWKATEYRSFLLYYGIVSLKGVLSKDLYKHYLSLVVSIRILCEANITKRNNLLPFARKCLDYFVWKAKDHYGRAFTVYNVHNLLHLSDDVENFNLSLDEMSCFPFENYLGWLKKLVKGRNKPLVQLVKRLDEYVRHQGSIVKRHLGKVDSAKNSWFLTTGGYVVVREVRDEKIVVDFVREKDVEDFFTELTPSRDIGIVVIRKTMPVKRKLLCKSKLLRKCVAVPYKDNIVLISLLGDFNFS